MSDGVEYYDSEQLIFEVEKRPPLYDKNIKEYNDKFVREKLWREVCDTIIPNWAELNQEGKNRTGRDVQRKWKNIRDCFRKELNYQRRWKPGNGKRKRRKYIFYDQLLFLLPTIQERDKKYESAQSSGEDAEENFEDVNTVADQKSKKAVYKPLLWKPKGRKHPVYMYEESSCPSMLQDSEVEEIDEDKYFLLSLLPSFRNLTPDQKFTAKIEFLQSLRNLTYPPGTEVLATPVFDEQPHTSFDIHEETDKKIVKGTKQEADDY